MQNLIPIHFREKGMAEIRLARQVQILRLREIHGRYRSNDKDVALICAHSQSSPVETLGATLCRKVTLADLILLVVRCISLGHKRRGSESLQLLTN